MNDVIGKYFELEKPFTDALVRLENPAPGVVRSQKSAVMAAIRLLWAQDFPGVPFPGDEIQLPQAPA